VVQAIQILGLLIVAGLVVLLFRWARQRSQKRYEALAPQPPSVSEIVAAADPVPKSNGSDPQAAAKSNGAGPDVSELEAELKEIYERVGQPEAFEEAKGKVTDLAAELVERDGVDMNHALRAAYLRSLTEHREYLAANGLA
jgi:hypothetical protein